ncbi:hypothetical protein SSYIS1_19800 [Serratia symbiotica]|uniref:Uncharacterized protein n=1 Tax=Serratia symbiotica TaxID=138074 RepID=A0A455VGV3_9GAMM|nr:hypothetical protein SSYIS1_19800 [Serratia symbiotica]
MCGKASYIKAVLNVRPGVGAVQIARPAAGDGRPQGLRQNHAAHLRIV